MLKDHSVIDENIARRLKAMVGFRNIAVHDDQNINLDILEQIVVNHLSDFTAYTKQILNFQGIRERGIQRKALAFSYFKKKTPYRARPKSSFRFFFICYFIELQDRFFDYWIIEFLLDG